MDGYGGPLYTGTGCFHRRNVLCGTEFGGENNEEEREIIGGELSVRDLEENVKGLASCAYEENTQWGKEVGSTLYVHVGLKFRSILMLTV